MYLGGMEQHGAILRKQSQMKAQREFLDHLGVDKLHQYLISVTNSKPAICYR